MVAARLLQTGAAVLKPMGDNLRYDLVIDRDGKFYRVQCKMGKLKAGSVHFSTCSSTAKESYEGQIEYFGVYCPDNDESYLIPIEDCKVGRQKSLRVQEAKNGQTAGVTLAGKYKLGL